MNETMTNTDYRLYKAARGGKNGFVDFNDPAALEQLRNQYQNTDISISVCSYRICNKSSKANYPLYVIIRGPSLKEVKNSAIKACYYFSEYLDVSTDHIHIIYNSGGTTINKDESEGNNGVREDATAAKILLLIPSVVFDGHPTPLMQRINYQLARQVVDDVIENIDIDVYQKDYMINLPNSRNNAGNYNIPLQLKELIYISEKQIFELAKKPGSEDSYVMPKKAPDTVEAFAQLHKQAKKEYKRQRELIQLMVKDGWQIPPCIRYLLFKELGDNAGLEACRITAQFFAAVKASEYEIWHHIQTWARRNAYKDYQRLKAIIVFAIENPQFAGCEHKLLKRFCPAGKCFMADSINEYENPHLFEQV